MDHTTLQQDVKSSAASRPASVLFSSSRPSTPTASAPQTMRKNSLYLGDVAVGMTDSNLGRDIEPYEAQICEFLTEQIINGGKIFGDGHATTSPLARTLVEAAATIQYHAKWFAPGPLSTLFETALRAAGLSTSTADLFCALEFIDTVATYSHLPSLLPATRFIAIAYYQGSRSVRHKRLSQSAWVVAEHILESHVGGQFIGDLLDIISDPENVSSRGVKFLATAGALMLVAHKLLPKPDRLYPVMQPTQILYALQHVRVGENPVLREQVLSMLSTILLDQDAFTSLDNDGGLEFCLELIQRCLAHPMDQEAADKLFNALELRFSSFEPRNQPAIARLYIDTRRRLPADYTHHLLTPWRRSLLMDDHSPWGIEYRNLLSSLCACPYYTKELQDFINIAVSAYFRQQNPIFRKDFVNTLETLILDPAIEDPVRDVLSRGLIGIFMHNMQKPKWEAERNMLFPLLCRLSLDCVEIADVLFRLRADASCEGYIEASHKASSDIPPEITRGVPHVQGLATLAFEAWVQTVRDMVASNTRRWQVYDRLLTSMAAQIRNHTLWYTRPYEINALRQVVCDRLNSDSFVEPPAQTGLNKSYVVAQLVQILTAMTSYHNQLPRNDMKAAILTCINIAGSRDHTVSIHCIHALTIFCYELPEFMAGYMDVIISKMSKMVTQRHLAIYVLEFLAGLSRLPSLQEKLRLENFKRIFGVCHSYLQTIRGTAALERRRTPTSEVSAGGSSSTSSNDDMAQYVYALAHHVITFWYVALKSSDRRQLKDFISSCLKYTDADGREHIEEQGLVTIDLMDRVDAEEGITAPDGDGFDPLDGRVVTSHRLSGLLLITTATALRTGKTIVTIRRPSGTAQRSIPSSSARLHPSSDIDDREVELSTTVENDNDDYITVFPDDMDGRTYGKVSVPRSDSALGSSETITLPEDDIAVKRAIDLFDHTSALDSHKAGVIYIGEGQRTESEILLNQSGSPDYRDFLDDLGTLRALKGADFNAQGLDRSSNADGEHTIVWNNDVTELVWHITTFMPMDSFGGDQMTIINKKRHIGNDFVNVIFNNSGLPFRFDTFPSAFNYVYIVISPSERTSFLQARTITMKKEKKERFYNVSCLTRPGYPNLSSACEEKVISGASLGAYIRNLTLNACVFSAMWNADEVGEYPSSWRRRLQMLRRLADQHRHRAGAAAAAEIRTRSSGNASLPPHAR